MQESSRDQTSLFFSDDDGLVHFWDDGAAREVRVVDTRSSSNMVRPIAMSSDREYVLMARIEDRDEWGRDPLTPFGMYFVWDLRIGQELPHFGGHDVKVDLHGFTPDGRGLVGWFMEEGPDGIGPEDVNMCLAAFDLPSGGVRSCVSLPDTTSQACVFSEDSHGRTITRLDFQGSPVRPLVFIPDGKSIWSTRARERHDEVLEWDL